jgi:hypothetical protein
MTTKWKIFFGLNFLIGLPAFIFLVVLIIKFTGDLSSDNYIVESIFGFALLAISGNNFLNILLLQRYFPDRMIPRVLDRVHLVSLTINFIVAVGLILVCSYALVELFSEKFRHQNTEGRTILIIFLVMLFLQLAILVIQTKLPLTISRNTHDQMHSLIDSIGEE